MKRTWWFALLVLAPLIAHFMGPGAAQPAAAALGGRCSPPTVPCQMGLACDTSTFGSTVGVCVAQCAGASCRPGQIADPVPGGGCVCVAAEGPGKHCVADSSCASGEKCVTFLPGAFGTRTPGSGVCIPSTTPTCTDGVKLCTGTTKCAHTTTTQGYCAPVASSSPSAFPCRFDEQVAGGACVPVDPVGNTCTSACSLANASRPCPNPLNKCALAGMCAAAETCGNGLDDNCNGVADDCACYRLDVDHDRYCEPGACQVAASAGPNQIPQSSCLGDEPVSCDQNAGMHPGAAPVCGTDTDCDGDALEGCTCYRLDGDHDGYCEPGACQVTTTPAANQVAQASCVGTEPVSCDADGGRHPGAAPVCGTDTDCNGNAQEGCPDCERSSNLFDWSCYRKLDSGCRQIVESADPDTWADNWLCPKQAMGLRWSAAGPIKDMFCTKIYEDAEPPEHTWNDNYLCLPGSSHIQLAWSQAGPRAGYSCVQWLEPADPHAWSDNYLCSKEGQCPLNDRDCLVCPGKDSHLCCTVGGADLCGTTQQCTMLRRPGKPCDPQREDLRLRRAER